MKIQVEVFWVETQCNAVIVYQCFGRPCCLHLQGEVTLKMEAGRSSETLVILLQHYTGSQLKRPRLELQISPPFKYFSLYSDANKDYETQLFISVHISIN